MSVFAGRFMLLLVVAIEMKCLLSFECSSNAPLIHDGNLRVFRASGALTCSWVLIVPENYTVKLTITQMNVDSGGNLNCGNDYLQIRDGGNSSETSLLGQLCNSRGGPNVFRSSGTELWMKYKSTQSSNSFEASFKKLLSPSFCPPNVISDGTPGLLASPYYPKDIPNDMECSWNITGPSDSRLVLLFRFLCLGICTSPASQCSCDSLSISNVFGARQICPQTELIPFISIGNRISLSMVTDEQYNSKGFLGKHESVSRLGGLCSQMVQLTNMSGWFSSPGFPSNYPANTQCAWNISIPSGFKIYLTFLEFDVEECDASCTCDYVEVTFTKAHSSQKRCGSIASGGWLWRNAINDDIIVRFKSDSHGTRKGFEAVYTFIPLDTWDSVPSAFCPWTDPIPTTQEAPSVQDSEASIRTATAGTSDEDSTSTVATEENTKQNSKVATKENLRDIGARVYGRGVSRLLASCAFVVLYLLYL
ncbi:CUB domain-containing protein 2-like [Montipora capricornis]|uniref:CUB domain-containing protein 2-like n=1 Tax=Montipora capricornis TaxID=246305 RepID=UPI0035F1793C